MMSQADVINDPKPNILVSHIMKSCAQKHNSRKPFLCVIQGALQASREVESESPSLKENYSSGLLSCAEEASLLPFMDFNVRVQRPSKVCNVFNNIKIPTFCMFSAIVARVTTRTPVVLRWRRRVTGIQLTQRFNKGSQNVCACGANSINLAQIGPREKDNAWEEVKSE